LHLNIDGKYFVFSGATGSQLELNFTGLADDYVCGNDWNTYTQSGNLICVRSIEDNGIV
jgi:hypothetical protein